MRKFINCDILAVLNEIMRHHTQNYQEDFNIDKEILLEAADEPNTKARRYLWMSRRQGTHCLKESEIYLKDTYEHNTWRFYDEQTRDKILAYAVEIDGMRDGVLKGDVYELDYHESAERVRQYSVDIKDVELFYGDEQKTTIPYTKDWYDEARDYDYYEHSFLPADYAAYSYAINSARAERLTERYADWSLEKLKLEYGENGIDAFSIYQLNPDKEEYLFESYSRLERRGFNPTVDDYSLLYTDELDNQTLEDLYMKFNIDRPRDFIGHSLSISDVIVTIRNGTRSAYFVDSVGFKKLPDFFTGGGMQMQKEMEM